MAFFSIIIPVYNTQEWIKRCLDSCIQQTFSEIEIIVVDDCGNDDAINIATQYSKLDSRIKIISNKENLGLFHTRIAGEKQASGEYIICLDSDDFIDTKLCEIVFKKITRYKKENRGGGARYCKFWRNSLPYSSIS